VRARRIGSARGMATATDMMRDEAGWTAQRAAHAATRHESKRDRWLKTRRISTDSANAKWRTYLGRPHHLPSTTDILPTSRTLHVAEDDSKQDLQKSVTPVGPTRPHGRAKAVSGGSDTSDMMYMDRRWWRRVPAMRNVKTRPLESIEDERTHLDSATT
jgi:hypothetical protein